MLPNCTDYWDGTEISTFNRERQAVVLEMSKQWQQEGMTVHAFAYDPVSVKVRVLDATQCSRSCSCSLHANTPRFVPFPPPFPAPFQEAEIFDMIDEQLAAVNSTPAPSPALAPVAKQSPAPVAGAGGSGAPSPEDSTRVVPFVGVPPSASSHAPLHVTAAQLAPVSTPDAGDGGAVGAVIGAGGGGGSGVGTPPVPPDAALGLGASPGREAPVSPKELSTSQAKPPIGLSVDSNAIFLLTLLAPQTGAQSKKVVARLC